MILTVELQPNSYKESLFINTAVCFLWEKCPELDGILTYDISRRICINGQENIAYDDSFKETLFEYAQSAIENVNNYFNFQNSSIARQVYSKEKLLFPNANFWNYYDYSMLCFLDNESKEGRQYFDLFLSSLEDSIYESGVFIDWRDELHRHCIQEVLPHLSDMQCAIGFLKGSINNRRELLVKKGTYLGEH